MLEYVIEPDRNVGVSALINLLRVFMHLIGKFVEVLPPDETGY